jgi:16S rRNA A1518/A1519 N6-dimethyltransferase RsmA/KsgA/DIM1 with predicted DNA glycosylase/AP lyase activity
LHSDTRYAEGNSVLEAGCGVGAQTLTLASRSARALYRTAEADGVFCYTFFKATAVNVGPA